MNFNIKPLLKVFLLSIVFVFQYSCSKDSDLLAEYVVSELDEGQSIAGLAINDTYQVALSGAILDVLANDTFENEEEVIITETSTPENGTVVINNDDTLTYTPNEEIVEQISDTTNSNEVEVIDTFTYTTEIVNEDDTVETQTGSVTVTITENRAPITGANVYYVTTTGKSNNSGTTESTAWNIQHAFSSAKAGDVIHIKAGNYGSLSLSTSKSGTTGNPIRFIGYDNNPGDVLANEGSTFHHGNVPNGGTMPLIKGNRTNNEGQGTGINIAGSNVEISNFQIMYYSTGIFSKGSKNVLDNIVVYEVGDFNPAHSYPNGTSSKFENYDGQGIAIFGNYSQLLNSIVINAGAEGIKVSGGKNQIHSFNKVYSDTHTNPTDYYYLINKGGENNIINDVYINRRKGLYHKGHGLVCKEDASYNTFTNVTLINTRVEMSFAGVHDNLVKNGSITGSHSNGDNGGGLMVANGAHHNVFENISVDNVRRILHFSDWNDGLASPLDQKDAGHHNDFINITGTNSATAIYFDAFETLGGIAHDNNIIDSEFRNLDRIFLVGRANSGNKFRNCSFENIAKFEDSTGDIDYRVNSNTVFENCSGSNLGFNPPF